MKKTLFEREKLISLLKDYWLATDRGPMIGVINEIETAYRFRREVKVICRRPMALDIGPLLEILEIPYTFDWTPEHPELPNLLCPHVSDPNEKHRRVVIPSMSSRLADFELLVPFTFHRVLKDLRKSPGVDLTTVHSLFLCLLETILCHEPNRSLADQVRTYVEDNYDGIPDKRPIPHQTKLALITYKEFEEKHAVACMYMGLHALGQQGFVPRFRSFKLNDIGLVLRNMSWLWDKQVQAVDEEVVRCLRLRLDGQSEEQIARDLRKENPKKYIQWLRENHIDLTNDSSELSPRAIYERWVKARDQLFVERGKIDSELREIQRHNKDPIVPVNSMQRQRGVVQDRVSINCVHDYIAGCSETVSWGDIGIKLIDGEKLRVRVREREFDVTYVELGFKNNRARSNAEPIKSWLCLLLLIKKRSLSPFDIHGQMKISGEEYGNLERSSVTLSHEDKRNFNRLKNHMKTLNGILVEAFGIKDKPVIWEKTGISDDTKHRSTVKHLELRKKSIGAYRPRFQILD